MRERYRAAVAVLSRRALMGAAKGGRANHCPLCLATPHTTCTSEKGTPRGDHTVRIHGIRLALPRIDAHVEHPLCRCHRCSMRRYKKHVREENERNALAFLSQQKKAPIAEQRKAVSPEPVGRPTLSAHPHWMKAPCYQCGASARERCSTVLGTSRGPHLSRGYWGAWRYQPGTTDIEVARRRLHEQTPTHQRPLKAQPEPLPIRQQLVATSRAIPAQRGTRGQVLHEQPRHQAGVLTSADIDAPVRQIP